MGRRFALLLAAVLTIALALAGAAQAATLSGTLERVRVTDTLAAPGATATVVDPATQRAVETATAGSDGSWSATVPDGVYDVEYAYSGHRSERVASVLAYGDVRLGAIRFVLDGYARFSGTVSAQGRAVARAAVTLCATTYTGSAGSFTVDCPQGDHRLSIDSGGWTVRADSVPLTADRVIDVRVPSRRGLTIRVLDGETEVPIENAQVVLPELSSPIALGDDVVGGELRTAERSVATNAAGEAAFTIFSGAREVGDGYGRITAPTPRHYEGWFSVSDADENGLIERSLPRLAHVTGTISDSNGPRAGVSVGGRDTSRHTVTGADGSFSVWVWPTEQFIVVDPDSGDWYSVDLDRSEDRDDVRLTLPRRQQFEIRVVDGDGAPVAGATVHSPSLRTEIDWGGGLHGDSWGWFPQTATDRDGVVRFDALVGARSGGSDYGVVTPPAGSSLQRTVYVIDEPTTTVTLTDQPGRVPVRGSVRIGGSGAGAAVTLGGETRTADQYGSFAFAAQPGGSRLHASWNADGSAWTIDGPLDVYDRYLYLESRTAPVTVHVRDADGEPVAGATVALPRHSVGRLFYELSDVTLSADPAPIVTGADGDAVATVPADAGSSGVATVTRDGGAPQTFRLDADGETTVALAAEPRPVNVSGTILSSNGRPVAGISVGGRTEGTRTLTDGDGRFEVDVHAAEELSVSWQRSADRYVVELDLSEDRSVTLTLPWQTTWPAARVFDRDAAPVVDATVQLPAVTTAFDWGGGIAGRAIEHRTATVDRDGWAWVQLTYGNWTGDGTVTVTPPAGSRLPGASAAFDGSSKTFVLDDEPGLVLFDGFLAMGRSMPDVPITVGGVRRTTDQSGDFRLVVPAGRHQLHAEWQEEDGGSWQLDGPIELTDHTNGNFRSGWSAATVHVRDAHGQPVAGATVALPLHTASGQFRWFAPDVTLSAAPAPIVTGADGDAVVRVPWNSEPQGEATVTGPDGTTPQSFRLDPSGETTVTLAPETAVVSGTVVEADGSPSTRVLRVLVDNSGTSTPRPGSFTRTLSLGQHQLLVNGSGFTLEGTFTVTGDRMLTVRLPPMVSLSVRALGGGRALAGASVAMPWTDVTGSFGDLDGGRLREYRSAVETGADGIATFSLSAGSTAQSERRGFVQPPEGSAYEPTAFDLPALDRDASIDVQLGGGPVRTGPQIELAASPDPLVRGDWWSVSRVAVQVTASDDDGVASLACSVDGVARTFTQTRTATTRGGTFYVNTEGRHTAACTAVDGAGRAASQERAVNLDLKNPAAPTASADRPADSPNGWWRDSVTVSFADNGDPLLADGSAGSGVEPGSVPAPVTYDRSGTFVASGTVTDRSGRSSAAGRLTVKVDADAPTSTLTCPVNPVVLGGSASARWQDADGQSGLPNGSSGSVALDTSSIGSFAATHTAIDRVGHETVSSCRYQVVYAFAWRGNVQAAPALNAIAPGVTTQTVWFSIGGDQGRDPIANGWPQVEPVDCATGAPSGRASAATVAGPLAWDAVNGRYGIAWDVRSDLPSDSCAALRLLLDDGVEREARFAR